MTPRLRLILQLGVVAAVGAGIGYFAGARSFPSSSLGTPLFPRLRLTGAAGEAEPPRQARSQAGAWEREAKAPPRAELAAPDLPTTLQRLREEKHPTRRGRLLAEWSAALDARGVQAAIEVIAQDASGGDLPFKLLHTLLRRWTEIDPRAAAQYAAQMPARWRWMTVQAAVGGWIETDLEAARAWVLASTEKETRKYCVSQILSAVQKRDGTEAALRFMNALPSREDREQCRSTFFGALIQEDIAKAAELALQLSSPDSRRFAVEQVVTAWAKTDPAKASAWYFGNPTVWEQEEWRTEQIRKALLESWVRAAPSQAMDFVTALPPGQMRRTMIASLGATWGAAQPEATAAWLQSLPKGPESAKAFGSLISSWCGSDAPRAAAFVLALPADRSREDLLGQLGRAWAGQDAAATLAWAQAQNDPFIERLVASEAVARMAVRDLPNAERHLAQLQTPRAQTAAIVEISNELAQHQDAETAVRWLMSLSPEQPVGNGFYWVGRWAEDDPDAAGRWLNEQPTGPRRDAAVSSYAETLSEKDAPSAAAWAASITDEKQRSNRLKAVVKTWAGQDAPAARAWVLTQPLAQQRELQAELERR